MHLEEERLFEFVMLQVVIYLGQALSGEGQGWKKQQITLKVLNFAGIKFRDVLDF